MAPIVEPAEESIEEPVEEPAELAGLVEPQPARLVAGKSECITVEPTTESELAV